MSQTREVNGAYRKDRTAGEARAFLPEGAFVVQVRGGLDGVDTDLTGRVEHVVSGQAAHFGSPGELLTFLRAILRGNRQSNE